MKRLIPGILALALLASLTGSLVWGQPPITPNTARIRGAALGANPALLAEGLSANIGLEFITVGTGGITLTAPGGLLIAQGALTAAALNLSGTATWNNVAVTFTGWRLNVTDTASAAASLLLDLQVGGTSRLNLTKTGTLTVVPGGNFSPLVLTGGTVTTSNPLLSATQTWNAGAVTFNGLLLNVTDTASVAGSTFFDFQIAAASRANLTKDGRLTLANGGNANTSLAVLTGGTLTTSNPVLSATQTWNAGGVTFNGLLLNVTDTASAVGSTLFDFQVGAVSRANLTRNGRLTLANGGNVDTSLAVLTGGTILTSNPVLSATQTWNAGAVTFNGLLLNVTDTASAAASTLTDLQIGGASRWNVTKNGAATLTNGANANVSPLTLTGGTLTTSNPLLVGTQTWNAAGVTFEGLSANITNTASAAGSRFLTLQRGGTLQFAVTSGATGTGLRVRTAQQAVPTCANCGATGTVAGTDAAGVITIAGAGPASPITVTFSGTYESVPACTAANRTTAANSISRVDSTATTVVIYFLAGPGAADLIAYTCLGTS